MKKKKLFAAAAMSLAILMSVSLSGCGESKNNDNSVVESSDTSEEKEPTTYGTIEWPSDGLGSFIPVPISKTGEIIGIHQIAFWQLLQKLQSQIFQNTLTNVKIRDLALIVWRATQVIWPKTGMVTKLRLYLKTTIL